MEETQRIPGANRGPGSRAKESAFAELWETASGSGRWGLHGGGGLGPRP